MANFNLANMTNEELDKKLFEEITYYDEDMHRLAKIIRKQLPKQMVYRLISKLYRVRMGEQNGNN